MAENQLGEGEFLENYSLDRRQVISALYLKFDPALQDVPQFLLHFLSRSALCPYAPTSRNLRVYLLATLDSFEASRCYCRIDIVIKCFEGLHRYTLALQVYLSVSGVMRAKIWSFLPKHIKAVKPKHKKQSPDRPKWTTVPRQSPA
jgi:hypothetical protein